MEKINAEDIIKLVNQLPTKAAMVLKLFAIEGYNHKEIADIMEISEGTSKSQLNRARFLFKEAMSKQCSDDSDSLATERNRNAQYNFDQHKNG